MICYFFFFFFEHISNEQTKIVIIINLDIQGYYIVINCRTYTRCSQYLNEKINCIQLHLYLNVFTAVVYGCISVVFFNKQKLFFNINVFFLLLT